MDPNACWLRFLAACNELDWKEAYYAINELCEWFDRGGFRITLENGPKANAVYMIRRAVHEVVKGSGIDIS